MDSNAAGRDRRSDRLYLWGGACLLIVAVLFVLLIVFALALFSSLQDLYPTTPLTGTGLDNLARNAVLARVSFGTGMLSDLVLITGIVALYAALEDVDRDTMRVASLFMGLYVVLDLAVTGMNVAALVSVSQDYASSSVATQQSSFAVASYIKAVISVSVPLSSAVLSVGILLTGLVLREGSFGTGAAYLGIASGVVGVVYGFGAVVPVLTSFQALSAVLELAWFALMGWKLIRLSRTRQGGKSFSPAAA